MRTRIFKNWVTSIIGALLMLAGVAMIVFNNIPADNVQFDYFTSILTLLLGWVFINSKDDLLEALFFKIFKIDKNGNI